MLRKSLILKLFDAFSIQRWNDKIRPTELVEMDKNAHKMVIAYCLARYEEDGGNPVSWDKIIQGGLFELLRRVVLSDIKSPVYRKIKKEHGAAFLELSKWVFTQLEPYIDDAELLENLKNYLLRDNYLDPLTGKILTASHIYSSYWEFQILRQANPNGYQINDIDRLMNNDLEPYLSLTGMQKIVSKCPISSFIDLVGQLRFQVRWGQTTRIPPTSVLGHSMMVACLAYFLSRQLRACERRVTNNFFGGLFHDLPESLTRDIISPVKGAVPQLPDIIKSIEKTLVEKEIYPLVEEKWKKEFDYFTVDEFKSKVSIDNVTTHVSSVDINDKYNEDIYNPFDGEILEVVDRLAAFVEAYKTIDAGLTSEHLNRGMIKIRTEWELKKVGGINIGSIYADF